MEKKNRVKLLCCYQESGHSSLSIITSKDFDEIAEWELKSNGFSSFIIIIFYKASSAFTHTSIMQKKMQTQFSEDGDSLLSRWQLCSPPSSATHCINYEFMDTILCNFQNLFTLLHFSYCDQYLVFHANLTTLIMISFLDFWNICQNCVLIMFPTPLLVTLC